MEPFDSQELRQHVIEAGRKLFVGCLNWSTSADAFRAYFESFGKVENSSLVTGPDGESRGFGFITFREVDSVLTVLSKIHVLDKRQLDVKLAQNKR